MPAMATTCRFECRPLVCLERFDTGEIETEDEEEPSVEELDELDDNDDPDGSSIVLAESKLKCTAGSKAWAGQEQLLGVLNFREYCK